MVCVDYLAEQEAMELVMLLIMRTGTERSDGALSRDLSMRVSHPPDDDVSGKVGGLRVGPQVDVPGDHIIESSFWLQIVWTCSGIYWQLSFVS